MTLKERAKISKQRNYYLFKDIYEECENNGCNKSFVDAFKARMFISPIQQTKAFINSVNRQYEYSFNPTGNLHKWEVFLSAVVKLCPNHEKVPEWKEALEILEKAQNQKERDRDGTR